MEKGGHGVEMTAEVAQGGRTGREDKKDQDEWREDECTNAISVDLHVSMVLPVYHCQKRARAREKDGSASVPRQGHSDRTIAGRHARDLARIVMLNAGSHVPVWPAASNAFFAISRARRSGGCGLMTPLSHMSAKHNLPPRPPWSPSAYSRSDHSFRTQRGSLRQGWASRTALTNILTPLRELAMGPSTDETLSWPSCAFTALQYGRRSYEGRRV